MAASSSAGSDSDRAREWIIAINGLSGAWWFTSANQSRLAIEARRAASGSSSLVRVWANATRAPCRPIIASMGLFFFDCNIKIFNYCS